MLITRRRAIASTAAGLLAARYSLAAQTTSARDQAFIAALKALEKKSGGRLGCALMYTSTNSYSITGNRLDQRFSMCSTHKFLSAAFVLHRVDKGEETLDRKILIPSGQLLANSPVTAKLVGDGGATMYQLCEAAVTQSDNTAANLLLASFGGPAALTAYLRSTGDRVTRLDRTEPTLNEAIPGDPRDTTSPEAIVQTLQRHVFGYALKPASRDLLTNWLVGCKTGDARLRAGLPKDWKVGDKTGTGQHGTSNDVAVIWPTNHAPIIVSALLTESPLPTTERDAIIAEVGKLVAATLQPA